MPDCGNHNRKSKKCKEGSKEENDALNGRANMISSLPVHGECNKPCEMLGLVGKERNKKNNEQLIKEDVSNAMLRTSSCVR